MKKLLSAILLFGAMHGAHAADSYVVGIIAPTTGPIATVGTRQLTTVQWWEQDINKKGGINGHPVEVISCDDGGSPDHAVTCGRDLLAKGSLLILNASVTGPILAVMPLLTHGPVMVTPSPNVLPDPSTYVFQTSASDLDITRAIADFLKQNHKDRLAMVASTDASGEVGTKSAATVFPEAGIKYDLARIDLRANDASIQLANVVKDDVPLVYSNYSGAGAATVVKSFNNLGLTQPLLISYANLSEAFIAVIKNDMPKRLLGTGVRSLVPELLQSASEKERLRYFTEAYKAWSHENIDQLTLNGLSLADTAEAILSNVKDLKNPDAVRDFLESTPIKSAQPIHFSKTSHVGLHAADIAILEFKQGHWMVADPLQ